MYDQLKTFKDIIIIQCICYNWNPFEISHCSKIKNKTLKKTGLVQTKINVVFVNNLVFLVPKYNNSKLQLVGIYFLYLSPNIICGKSF